MIRLTEASLLGLSATRRLAIARSAIWIGIASQVAWMLSEGSGDATGPYDLAAVAFFTLLALTSGRRPLPVLIARGFLATAFLGSVADRFGIFGGPGTADVSWGSFAAFIDYTREVNAFLPGSFAPALAVLATGAEAVVGLGIVFGGWQPFAARVATCILITFGLAMTISLGWRSPFEYSVWLLAGGTWMLAVPIASRWFPFSGITRRHREPTRSTTDSLQGSALARPNPERVH